MHQPEARQNAMAKRQQLSSWHIGRDIPRALNFTHEQGMRRAVIVVIRHQAWLVVNLIQTFADLHGQR